MKKTIYPASRHENSDLKIKVKIWLDDENGDCIFGDGRLALIKAVEETGSLHAASAKLGMSYRKAWGLIRKIEQRTGLKILERQTGGIKGGGSSLTENMKEFVREYEKKRREIDRYAEMQSGKMKF
jgi:molybdate transport system regulatory protein